MAKINPKKFRIFLDGYREIVRGGVEARASLRIAPEWLNGEVSSVVNGHLARQASLSLGLAEILPAWNGHIAPLVLRAMVDCVISFRWILKDPRQRSQEFIGYGLGQAKLSVSHLQEKQSENPDDPDLGMMIEAKMAWVNSQRWHPFVDVNLGSWSGSSVRQMAKEAGDEDLYKFAFSPFSACVHNTWEHIDIWNTMECSNALHKRHRVPAEIDMGCESDYLYRSAKYVELMFDSFDEASGFSSNARKPRGYFNEEFEKVIETGEE